MITISYLSAIELFVLFVIPASLVYSKCVYKLVNKAVDLICSIY